MSESDKRLARLLSEELARYKSIYVPVKSSLLRRALIRKVRCKKLHPNPNDEFCLPEVGPNYAIISKYEQQFLSPKTVGYTGGLKYSEDDEALTIERIRPDGYMILNGHHRWAAAYRIGKRRVPVKIVNLTHEEDILASLHKSSNTRRVTLDLDEVVFRNQKGAASEKQLPFPLSLRFREPLRLGVPALFRFLKRNGYDVWVYTSKYASVDYLNHYFKAYRTWVSGVVPPEAWRSFFADAIPSPCTSTGTRFSGWTAIPASIRSSGSPVLPLPGPGKSWISLRGLTAMSKQTDNGKMRVSFDLDEVLFVSPKTHQVEPPPRYPFNKIYQERLRKGTPELIHRLQELGYEVWVYTSSFRSEKYIRHLFRLYGVRFDGIVNGNRHLAEVQRDNKTVLPQKIPSRYRISLHIDDEAIIASWGREFGFETYLLDAEDADWKEKIIARADEIRQLRAAR